MLWRCQPVIKYLSRWWSLMAVCNQTKPVLYNGHGSDLSYFVLCVLYTLYFILNKGVFTKYVRSQMRGGGGGLENADIG